MANKFAQTAKWMSTAGVITACVAFTPVWEGMDKTARKDRIGTGHPITYCYGQTSEFGDVKEGQRFNKAECDAKLAESLPKYLNQIEPYLHPKAPLPDKVVASLLDAAYNAGPGAVSRSPMVAKINAGDVKGGCEAFKGWYVRSDGQVRTGLIARRSGIDSRKSEMQLCLEGVKEGATVTATVPAIEPPNCMPDKCCSGSGQGSVDCPRDVPPKKTIVHKKHMLKPHVVVCTGFLWFRECK